LGELQGRGKCKQPGDYESGLIGGESHEQGRRNDKGNSAMARYRGPILKEERVGPKKIVP